MESPSHRIGVVGTGFISKGFVKSLIHHPDYSLSRVLTRRDPSTCGEYPRREVLTNSAEELVEHSDIIFECSGDVIHATDVVDVAVRAGKPVVTMDSEFHVTTGTWFVDKGLVTEAEGDQPGCLAALHENVLQMGFRPLVLGNVKGFHDPNPGRESMERWSQKQRISLEMVIAATDGTKIQFEQAFVANGLGARIAQTGMIGGASDDMYASGYKLAAIAKERGHPISDYFVIGKSPYRVFIVGEHDEDQHEALDYFKFGPGPYFLLPQTNILCHLEVMKTVRRVMNGGGVLLNNSATPTVSVGAVAKKDLPPGHIIRHALGNFDIRGTSVEIADHAGHVPMGLLNEARLKHSLMEGQMITFADVDVPDSLALRAWRDIESGVLSARR